MSREKTLVKKTAIYAVGNFSSKILVYIMTLVYSYFILPTDMGYYDLILTTISMLQPLIIFQLNDGVYRWLIDNKNENQQKILSTSFQFLCLTIVISEVCFAVICSLHYLDYSIYIGLLLASTVFYVYLQDATRGLGNSRLYAFSGVLNSFVMLICEIIGIVVLRLGVQAMLFSQVIANIACIVLLFVKQNKLRCVFVYRFDKALAHKLLSYSAPLVPNTICWWVVNSSDRYIVLFFLGATYNGIYSMANKFSLILLTITNIFFLAWQEVAIKEYSSPTRNEFFSRIFHKYYVLLLSLCLFLIPSTKIVIKLFVSSQYQSAWKYTGFLYMGAAFSALCSFLGMGYQISKETKRSMVTTVLAAFLNVVINIVLIKYIGLQAASFSTFAAFLFLFIIRIGHTRRYFKLSVKWKPFVILAILNIAIITITLLIESLTLCFILVGLMGIWMIWLNRSLLNTLSHKIRIRYSDHDKIFSQLPRKNK